MPSRLQRTDTIANIADFGALPGTDGANAAVNTQAFLDALASSTKVAIPATEPGEFYAFASLGVLPAGVEIFGQGPSRTILRYYPASSAPAAFRFPPGFSRGRIHGFRLIGPVVYPNSTETAISFDRSQFNWVHDVFIEDFATGVTFNIDAAAGYSAHNILERFEINRITQVGVFVGSGANGETIGPGRCNGVLNAAGDGGIAIHLFGKFALPVGPDGPTACLIRSVACETTFQCLRIENSRGVLVTGCFFEPAVGTPTPPRHMLDIDANSEGISLVGNQYAPSGPPPIEADRTPVFVRQVPEARSPALDAPSFPPIGYFNERTVGAGVSGTTAAYSNRIKNGDMSRGALFWPTQNAFGGTQVVVPNHVIGGRSLLLTVGTNRLFFMSQDVRLDSGLRSVTVNVRYRLLTPGLNGFRIELYDVASATVLGYYSDASPGGAGSEWQIRSLTGRFEGLPGGVQGPRVMRVRIFPYNRTSAAPAGQQVVVDSVWLVDGEYAAPYRSYAEGIEILRGDDRQLLVLVSPMLTAAVAPTALNLTNVPSNAVGMVLELRINAAQGSTVDTYLTIDDNEGGAAQQQRILSAPANGRWAMTDFTIPFTPSGPTPPQWSVVGPTGTNTTAVGIRLKAWVLRM